MVVQAVINPWAKSMGDGDFRPPHLQDPSTNFHET